MIVPERRWEDPDLEAGATVLIAVITRPQDLQRVRNEGWYRIPVAHAPRQLAANYLAFYQTAAFGTERWAIRHYAPILGYDLCIRRELLPDEAEHPRADQQYWRLSLGKLLVLEPPVPARRLRRVTFIMSSLGALRRASDIRELWQASDNADLGDDVWGAGIAGKPL